MWTITAWEYERLRRQTKEESAYECRDVMREERDNGEEVKCWGGERTAMSKLCLMGKWWVERGKKVCGFHLWAQEFAFFKRLPSFVFHFPTFFWNCNSSCVRKLLIQCFKSPGFSVSLKKCFFNFSQCKLLMFFNATNLFVFPNGAKCLERPCDDWARDLISLRDYST